MIVVGEASWDNTEWTISEHESWWQSFCSTFDWILVAKKTSKPPFGASDTESFARKGKNAASRFEVVYVRQES